MKYLSKLMSMLLIGGMLYSTGCTDYASDIEDLNQKVDDLEKELVEGQINPLKADLAKAKEDLEAALKAAEERLATAHKEDIDALKQVDSNLDAKIGEANAAILELEGALATEVEALEAEIQKLQGEIDALESALEAAKKEAKDDNDALKNELLTKITDLETQLQAKIAELQTKLEGDIADLREEMQEKIDAANDAIDEANKAIDALDLRADNLEAADEALQNEIDQTQADLATTNAELTKAKEELAAADAKLAEDLANAKAELEKAIADGDAKLQAALEEAVKNLEASIAEEKAAREEAVAKLEAAIEALNNKLEEELNLLKHRDAEFEAQLAAAKTGIEALGKKVDAYYAEVKADVAALDAKLSADIAANQAAIAQNKVNIDRALASIDTLNSQVAALQVSLNAMNTTLANHLAAYANFQAEVNGRLASLEAAQAALEATIVDLKENVIPAIEQQILINEELINQNVADIKANADALEEFKNASANTFDLLRQADEDLWTAIYTINGYVFENKAELAAIRDELAKTKTAIEDEIAAAFATLKSDINTINDTLVNYYALAVEKFGAVRAEIAANKLAIEAEVKAREEADKAISDALATLKAQYEAKVKELDDKITALDVRLATLERALEEYKEQVKIMIEEAVNRAVKESNDYTDKKANELQAMIQTNTDAIKALDAKLDQAIKDVTAAYEAADKEIREEVKLEVENLQEQINGILDRIQSIVYVPEYTDGKITIDYAMFGGKIVEGRSTIEYQVYPVEGAYAIEKAFEDKYEGFNIWFDMQGLKTRANAPELTVVDVVSNANGRLELTVLARNFSDAFYQQSVDENFAVSLGVDMGAAASHANLSTCYTQLIAARESQPIKMRIMATDDVTLTSVNEGAEFVDVTGNEEFYVKELEYANIDANPDFVSLPDYYLVFDFNGKTYTKAELAAFGYVVAPKMTSSFVVTPGNLVEFANIKNEVTGYSEYRVNILKADANAVGMEFNQKYVYEYPNSTETITAGSTLKIVAEQRTVNVGEFTETWTYSLDAKGDAGMGIYSRNITTTEKVFDGKELPEGVTLADVINGDKEPQIVVTDKDGEVVEDVITMITAKGDEVAIYFANFAWNEEYDVVAKYGVLNAAGIASMEVNVKFAVNTVDRSRQRIDVNLEASDVEFRSNLVLTNEISNGIGEIYEKLTTDHSNIDVEKDVWFQQNMIADKYTSTCKLFVDGATEAIEVDYNNPDWGTMLLIDEVDAAGQAVYTAYNYNNLDIIPEKITYVKTVKTWYGQEIVITKDVNFLFPTIEDIDFKHTNFVSLVNGIYQSKVHPQYDSMLANPAKPSDPIYNFDTQKVNMNAAFDLVVDNKFVQLGLEDGKAHTTNYDLVAEFMLENKDADGNPIVVDGKPELVNEYQGVTISGNSIKYNAKPKYVDVYGQLYLTNDNGAKYRLVTSFDDTAKYSTYRVYQFDPITEPEDAYQTIPVANSQTYTVNLFKYVDVYDYRDGYPTYPLFDKETGSYVMGNDANGFNTGYTSGDVYGIQFTWSAEYTSDDPEISTEEIAKFIDDTNLATQGVIVFDNSHELNLVKPIRVKATLNVSTVWSDHDVDVYITFAQQKGNVEE